MFLVQRQTDMTGAGTVCVSTYVCVIASIEFKECSAAAVCLFLFKENQNVVTVSL